MNDKIEKLKFAINQILSICNITEGQFNIQFNIEGMRKWAKIVQDLIDSGYDVDKLWEEQELLYTSSFTLRAAFAEQYCYNPINAVANIPPISPKRFEHMCKLFSKDVVPFLSYEEFYYALGLLDEMNVRRVFSRSKTNNNSVIFNAFIAKDKTVFMDTVKSLETNRYYPALYAALFYSTSFAPLLKGYFDKLAENESDKFNYMSVLYTIAPSSIGYLPYYYKYRQEKNHLENFLVDTRPIAEEYLGQLHYGILSIMEDEGIDVYLRSEMQSLYNERKFVFEGISPKAIGMSFDDSPEIERCIAAVSKGILYCIQEKLKIEKEREEKEREEQLVALESQERKDELEQHVVNIDKCTLGKSDFAWKLMGSCNTDICNKTYRKFLELLFLYLSGKDSRLEEIHALNVKLNENYCNTTKYIDTKINDFIFILGGELYEEENLSDNPVLNWCYSPQYELASFLYAFYGAEYEKSNTRGSREEKKLVINAPRLKSNGKNNCYSFMGKHIDLAINYRENAKARVEHWVKIIEDCCTIARCKISEEKKE